MTSKSRLTYLKYQIWQFQYILNTFNFGTNLGQIGGKYLIKIIFDIKIEVGILEISHVPNFNKF